MDNGVLKNIKVNYHYTNLCDYNCEFCFAEHSNISNDNLIIKTFENLITLTNRINLVGGEVFINIRILKKLITIGKKNNVEMSIVTNGFNLSKIVMNNDLEYIFRNISMLGISVDSFEKNTNIKIGRCNNKGNTLDLKSIQYLKGICQKYNVLLKINTVVSKYNLNEDFNAHIKILKPYKWKFFQVVSDNENYQIDNAEFNLFNKNIDFNTYTILKFETNIVMKRSYVMCNVEGDIYFDESLERRNILAKKYTKLSNLLKEIEFDMSAYSDRYKKRPFLICIDGLSGSGKTTQLEKLMESIKQSGLKGYEISLPTSNYYGKILKKLYEGDNQFRELCDELPSLNQKLISKDLKASYESAFSEEYDVCVMTRGIVATHALYEKHYFNKYKSEYLSVLQPDLDEFLIPDLTIFLDCTPEVVKSRLIERNRDDSKRVMDRLENLIAIRKRSLNLYRIDYKYLKSIIVNSDDSIEHISEIIFEVFKKQFVDFKGKL